MKLSVRYCPGQVVFARLANTWQKAVVYRVGRSYVHVTFPGGASMRVRPDQIHLNEKELSNGA